jgi:threonine/homoserine/homoserine lactone efflux protein
MMIVEGMLLGLAYVLPPGPVTAETVRRSLHGGIPAALAVQLGGVGGDFIYALLVLAGLSQFLNHTAVRPGAGLLGSVLLVVLGISALRGPAVPLTPVAAGRPTATPAQLARLAAAGLLVSLMNPFAVAFWMTVGTSATNAAPSWLAGFMLGSLAASLLTGLVAGRLHWQRFGRWLSAGCGCLLIAFGLKLSWAMFGLL